MADNSALLANVFQMVTKSLMENQQALNQADDNNHDHGDNMVSTFQTITKSMQAKKSAPSSTALAYAAKQLSKEAASGSGKLYAQGLNQAAKEFKGKPVDANSALQLLQMLIGGGQAQPQATSSQGGDLLGTLLGGMAGGQQQQTASSQGGDLLGTLLGGATGSQNQGAGSPGLDAGDLLNAGLAYLQAKQSGGSNAQALIQAVVAGSGMGDSTHRNQSTQLVVDSFLQALGTLTKR
jgi:hypothetical protein